ncbi:hypothetical protein, partial [Neglectibacter timonensis]|uniref:hypothetical protein n=1 Tax=Neglectibacter timonensis TaxID=1776382 RepID=UPI00399378D2
HRYYRESAKGGMPIGGLKRNPFSRLESKKVSCRAQICGILLSEQKEGEPPWPVMLKQSPIGSLSP